MTSPSTHALRWPCDTCASKQAPVRTSRLAWKLSLLLLVNVALLTGPSLGARAADRATWVLGTHYDELPTKHTSIGGSDRKVHVMEFFWYSCGHCDTFEPLLQRWIRLNRDRIEVTYVPVTWDVPQMADARLFYTLQYLGRLDLHQEVYDTVHRRKIRLMAPYWDNTKETQAIQYRWATSEGIPTTAFASAYNSRYVSNALTSATRLGKEFKIIHSPSVVVGGRYVTDRERAGGNQELIDLVDFLARRLNSDDSGSPDTQ